MRRFRPAIVLALPCALLLASAPLAAQQVYKWKDARGVTQYTSAPPPEGTAYETRQVDNRRRQAPQAGNEAPAEDAGCAIARGNLALLNGLEKLGPDEDGDGRPDRIYTDAERADQVALAEAAIKARCTPPPAPAAEREEELEETGDD